MKNIKWHEYFFYYLIPGVIAACTEKILYLLPRRLIILLGMKLYPQMQIHGSLYLTMHKKLFRRYLERLMMGINKHYLVTFIRSYFLFPRLSSTHLKKRAAARYKIKIPGAVDVGISNKCNLKCLGCYESEYTHDTLPPALLSRKIIRSANLLGINIFNILGGEPLMYPNVLDLLTNRNIFFVIATNSYFLDEQKAGIISRAGNIMLLFAMAGYRQNTDQIRGDGTYAIVRRKMLLLKERRAPFGVSVLVNKNNWQEVSALSFVDDVISWGGYYLIYIMYGPIGRAPDTDLMLNAGEKAAFDQRIDTALNEKPIGILNEMHIACGAGGDTNGKFYISPRGEIQPCAGIQYATHNIYNSGIREALQSDLFKNMQQLNAELSRGCPIHNAPEKVMEYCTRAGARPTQAGVEEKYLRGLKPHSPAAEPASTAE